MMAVKELAEVINKDCRDFKYFYAVGLVKETLKLWQNSDNFTLLNRTARVLANHYLKEREVYSGGQNIQDRQTN